MADHKCPGPECEAQIPYDMLACSRHWYQVPAPVRSAVWRAWANGEGAGSKAHTAAILSAIGTMRPLAPPRNTRR
jgi:hypothetical protein